MRRRFPAGFWSIWTAVAVDLLGFGIVIPLLPLYAERYGADSLTVGLLFASYSLAQFVFSPLWGRLSDRIGRRPVLLVTIAGSAVGSLVLGLAGSLPMLFAGRILDGASGASVAVARAAAADVAAPGERARLMGLLGAAFGIGFVIGPSIGSLAALGSPALPFFVAAAISTANLAAAAVRLPETRRAGQPDRGPRPAPVTALTSPVLRFVVLTFVGVTAFSAFEATFALLGDERLGMTQSSVALAFAGVGVILVVAQGGLVGPASRRLGDSGLIRLGLALDLGGFTTLALAASWTVLAAGLGLLALGQGLLTPGLSAAVASAAPSDRTGAALGLQQSAGGLARVLGPVLGGALFAAGSGLPYAVAAGLALMVLPLVPRSAADAQTAPASAG